MEVHYLTKLPTIFIHVDGIGFGGLGLGIGINLAWLQLTRIPLTVIAVLGFISEKN